MRGSFLVQTVNLGVLILIFYLEGWRSFSFKKFDEKFFVELFATFYEKYEPISSEILSIRSSDIVNQILPKYSSLLSVQIGGSWVENLDEMCIHLR